MYEDDIDILHGELSKPKHIRGTLSKPGKLKGKITIPEKVMVIPDTYDGAYEVIPTTDEQILYTKSKYMEDDVTVKSIPYFETSNQAGGDTVYIASEV